MLTCDWILETRTQIWESEYMCMNDDGYYQVPGDVLEKFQKDLNSLRSIVEYIPVRSVLFPILKHKLIFIFFAYVIERSITYLSI